MDLSLAQGVYLFLGYSKKDEELLKKVTGQGALEAIGAIQGLVSYHNVNSNKVSWGFSCNSHCSYEKVKAWLSWNYEEIFYLFCTKKIQIEIWSNDIVKAFINEFGVCV